MARWNLSLRYSFALAVLACFALCGFAQSSPPLLLRNPSLSGDKIAFLYANDVWTVSRQGGEARRLTSVNAVMKGPRPAIGARGFDFVGAAQGASCAYAGDTALSELPPA